MRWNPNFNGSCERVTSKQACWENSKLIVIKKTVIDSMIVAILIHKLSYLITLAIIIEMFTDCLRTWRIWTWKIWLDSYDSREEDVFNLESVLIFIFETRFIWDG